MKEGYKYFWRIKHLTWSDSSWGYRIERRKKGCFYSWKRIKCADFIKLDSAKRQLDLEVEADTPPRTIIIEEIVNL